VASFLSIGIPIFAIIVLVLVLKRDPSSTRGGQSSVRTLPKTELSRQVWKATRPPRAARRAAKAPEAKPKFTPLTPPAKVAPFRPPRQRDRRGA
jgi:hypothetical protein